MDSPSHLVGTDSAFPRPDKRRIGQQRDGVERSGGEVRSNWADDDEDHRFSCPRNAEGRLEEGEDGKRTSQGRWGGQ